MEGNIDVLLFSRSNTYVFALCILLSLKTVVKKGQKKMYSILFTHNIVYAYKNNKLPTMTELNSFISVIIIS